MKDKALGTMAGFVLLLYLGWIAFVIFVIVKVLTYFGIL